MAKLENKLIKVNRINRVIDLLVRGTRRRDIVFLLSTEWSCSEIWVDKYIHKAKQVIKEQFDLESIENMNAKYDYLYQEALKRKDFKEARSVMDSKQKLKGVVSKIDITTGGQPITTIKLVEVIKENGTGD